MTSETKITCDGCGADLTTTGAMPAYRVTLSSEQVPHRTDENGIYSVNAVIVRPWPRKTKHFCKQGCLRQWLETSS